MSSENTPTLHYQKHGGVATLCIDHPTRHNAMTFDMWATLPTLIGQVDKDPDVRVLVLRGAGEKAFSSGSDISQFGERRSTEAGVKLWNDTVIAAADSLTRLNKPSVAFIRGLCFGGGVGLSLHCDLRFATSDASFSIPAAKLGVGYYPSWLKRLASIVGPAVAKEIMFTARRYDAAQALRVGLINDIRDEAETMELVTRMATLAPLSLRASKMAIDDAGDPGKYGDDACQQALRACFASQDYKEGQAAFRDKRPPVFAGR